MKIISLERFLVDYHIFSESGLLLKYLSFFRLSSRYQQNKSLKKDRHFNKKPASLKMCS
jgi:hypothetical protein